MNDIVNAINKVRNASVYSRDKSDAHGEVFTPFELIDEMLDKLPADIWSDPTKTFFDPCGGKGNFPIKIIERLFNGLANVIPDEEERLKHIVENQIYIAEFQATSAAFCKELLQFGRGFKVNLYHGNTLKMPHNYFDKSWEEREQILKDNPDGYEGTKPKQNLLDLFA